MGSDLFGKGKNEDRKLQSFRVIQSRILDAMKVPDYRHQTKTPKHNDDDVFSRVLLPTEGLFRHNRHDSPVMRREDVLASSHLFSDSPAIIASSRLQKTSSFYVG